MFSIFLAQMSYTRAHFQFWYKIHFAKYQNWVCIHFEQKGVKGEKNIILAHFWH